ncbi:hypothetical protein B0T24DRAFT_379044 [Lasiosphaeria ovina]|uniref:Uncharacterized protein n=1 Tax=Lasiosphaeria ovina TaxID=92902 RepID=A0AAE0JZU7_9PEZI|nr:hypothetical protein B0T24DRAFT_379044 [Lasiosphaeria ovina]
MTSKLDRRETHAAALPKSKPELVDDKGPDRMSHTHTHTRARADQLNFCTESFAAKQSKLADRHNKGPGENNPSIHSAKRRAGSLSLTQKNTGHPSISWNGARCFAFYFAGRARPSPPFTQPPHVLKPHQLQMKRACQRLFMRGNTQARDTIVKRLMTLLLVVGGSALTIPA